MLSPSLHEGEHAIILTRNNGFLGKLIMWRYGAKFTHVAILRKEYGQYIVEDSDIRWFSSGVNRCSWEHWKHKKKYVDHIMISPDLIDRDRWAESLNKRYDVFAWFKHIGFWRRWKKDKRSAKAFTCWEWVFYILGLPNWWKAKPTRFENIK